MSAMDDKLYETTWDEFDTLFQKHDPLKCEENRLIFRNEWLKYLEEVGVEEAALDAENLRRLSCHF